MGAEGGGVMGGGGVFVGEAVGLAPPPPLPPQATMPQTSANEAVEAVKIRTDRLCLTLIMLLPSWPKDRVRQSKAVGR
jgi:hypothetical protein